MIERGRCAGRSHNHAFANSLRAIATLTLVLSGTIGTGRVAAASTSAPAVQTVRATALSEGRVVSASTAAQRAAPLASSTPHIMVVVEENEGYSDIIGSSSAPYINSLANTYSSATKWYAVQHNSPHDYLDLIVGSDLGLPNGKPYSNTTLVDELHNAGIPWKSYMESMPSNCFTGTTSNGLYDPNHNPFHYFKTTQVPRAGAVAATSARRASFHTPARAASSLHSMVPTRPTSSTSSPTIATRCTAGFPLAPTAPTAS